MNILFIGAHPDDIELSAAGTMLKYRERGDNIFMIVTTTGNIGSGVIDSKEKIAEIRANEAREAAKIAGAQIYQLPFDDELLINNEVTRHAMLNAIRWANPDVIFTHSPEDGSPDHHTTSQIVTDVVLSLPVKHFKTESLPCTKKISLFYWEPTAGVGFMPEVYVDITSQFENKQRLIKCHTSQFEWMGNYMDQSLTDISRIMAQFRGLQINVPFAEAFRAFRLHSVMPDFKILP